MFMVKPILIHVVNKARMVLSQINQETNKPKLAPLNESGVSELLNKVNMDVVEVISEKAAPSSWPRLRLPAGDLKTAGGK